ncbi:unnamed protein product, partial [Urochloa humidicola]
GLQGGETQEEVLSYSGSKEERKGESSITYEIQRLGESD